MGTELRVRGVEVQVAEVGQHHADKSGIQEMQHRVFVAADVAAHRKPLLGPGRVERPVGEFRGGVAKVVPGRIEERVGDVRFATRLAAALGTLDEVPLFVPCERAHSGIVGAEIVDEGELDRQVLLRHRDDPAFLAVHDGDWRTPVALPRDTPVVQPVLDARRRETALGEPGDDLARPLAARHTVERPRVHEHAVLRDNRQRLSRDRDDLSDRELELRGELEVPLVVRRDRHDGAGAVLHQDVVGNPDRDRFTRRRIAGVGADEDTGLRLFTDPPRHDVLGLHLPLICLDSRAVLDRGELVDERVLRREDQIRRAEHRVGTGREHGDLLAAGRLEDELRPFAPADPVLLKEGGGGRPVEVREVFQEALSVVRDAKEPLVEEALLDRRVAALAAAVDDLLVREHRLVLGAPIHRRALLVREPRLEELEKEPLRPLVVGRIGGGELVPPVEHAAEPAQLAAERGDVSRDQLCGIGADGERVVLGVNAEGVETHRLEHVVALESLEPAVDVRAREREHVADV